MTITLKDKAESPESDYDRESPRPFQAQSYGSLLKFPDIPASTLNTPSGNRDITVPVVDAIIVPTIRSAEQISSAIELASQVRCQLVTLYTDNFPAGLSPVLSRLKRGTAISLALRPTLRHHLLDLAADLPQRFIPPGALDISRKRNLGLLLGRACGWTRLLFLDDDIRRLNMGKLSSAAALLDKYPVVGLQVKKYPDASVVGHARRLTGRRQEPFISGGSLLVNPQRLNGFFPAIYHEDWLCIINHLRLGEVAIGGSVGQLPYGPFAVPDRARLEEFGDILASGLLWLVHADHSTIAAAQDGRGSSSAMTDHNYWRDATKTHFWEEVLNQRATLLDNISTRLKRLNPSDLSPLLSLKAAQQRCNELTADEFVAFTKDWIKNLAKWRDLLSLLPRVDSAEKALAELGLSHAASTYETHSEEALTRGTRWTGGFAGRWGRWSPTDGRHRFGLRSLRLWTGQAEQSVSHRVSRARG